MSKSRQRPPSSLASFFRDGVITDGEVLRYKDKTGKLMLVGRAREGGFEVLGESKLLKFAAWEAYAGSIEKKTLENTYTASGTTLLEEHNKLKEANRARLEKPSIIPLDLLLNDENDEFCYVCGLGGDLMCCETCPGTYHMACMNLAALPTDDWYCPACRCTQCGKGAFDTSFPPLLGDTCKIPVLSLAKPPGAALKFVSSSQGPQGEEPEMIGAANGQGIATAIATAAATAAPPLVTSALADTVSLRNGMQGDAIASVWSSPPIASKHRAEEERKEKRVVPMKAQVKCCVTGMCAHYSCLPPGARTALAADPERSQWMCSPKLKSQSLLLAELCAKGAVPFLSLQDGTQLSLQIIRGAAAAGTSHSGASPEYTDAQRADLRHTLSAALLVLRSAYTSFPDSRTGGDLLAWMVRGARFADGAADFSGMHTAVLFANSTLVGAACFRIVGPEAAEIPVLAIRPELRGCGLGGLFISRIEIILAAVVGIRHAATPAFTPWKHVYMPALMPHDAPLVQPAQQQWGYTLASPREMQALVTHRLVRMPGVLLAIKALSDVRIPRTLPPSLTLNLNADLRELLKQKFIRAMPESAATVFGGGSGWPAFAFERSQSMQGGASGGTPTRPGVHPRDVPLEFPAAVERRNDGDHTFFSFLETGEVEDERPAKQPRMTNTNGRAGSMSRRSHRSQTSLSESSEQQQRRNNAEFDEEDDGWPDPVPFPAALPSLTNRLMAYLGNIGGQK